MKLERDKYLIQEEFDRLVYAARTRPHVHALRDYALLNTGGMCGLRPIELVGLRHGDLSRILEKPSVLGVWTAKKRSASYDEVAMTPSAVSVLTKYLRSLSQIGRSPWLRVFPMTTRQANRIFQQYAEIAGLNSRYTVHALRHYRGVQLYSETKDVNVVKMALRHSSINSTMIYVHTVDHLEKAGCVDRKMSAEEEAFLKGP